MATVAAVVLEAATQKAGEEKEQEEQEEKEEKEEKEEEEENPRDTRLASQCLHLHTKI